MGQYFIPVIVDHRGRPLRAIAPADYGSGHKISTHSRADTPLMTAVHTLLALDGGARLVWAGDYDEPASGEPGLYWLVEPHHFVRFAGLIDSDEPITANAEVPATAIAGRYTCNPDKHQYIDNSALPRDRDGVPRTPLPWLTAEAGFTSPPHWSWARHRIYTSSTHPGSAWTPIKP